ncbi:MAG: hypothetical protein ABIY55_12260 [Kofleriaceae bacterium]
MDPYRGVAQHGSEGVCPWCQRTLLFATGVDTVVCSCGARSAAALVKPPPQHRRRRKRRSGDGAWGFIAALLDLLGDLF